MTYPHGDGGFASGVVTWTGTVYTDIPVLITWAVQVAQDAPYNTTIPNIAYINDTIGTFETNLAVISVPLGRTYMPIIMHNASTP